jgi:hypothetical protein
MISVAADPRAEVGPYLKRLRVVTKSGDSASFSIYFGGNIFPLAQPPYLQLADFPVVALETNLLPSHCQVQYILVGICMLISVDPRIDFISWLACITANCICPGAQ